MKNTKLFLLFSILLIIIILVGLFILNKINPKKNTLNIENEYTPEQEISEEQNNQTIITLYFLDKDSNQLKPEARLVNIKDIINNPYNSIINLLISGPKNEKLEKTIPKDAILLNSSLDGECLNLDFSDKILDFDKSNEKSKDNLIYSIVNTLTELNEVNQVKIFVNGQENEEFNDTYLRR